MNKKVIAGLLIAVPFLLARTGAPVLADGVLVPDSVYHDLTNRLTKLSSYGNNTEHLILAVSFEGDAASFAWVIPLPAKPQITTTNPELFWESSHLTATSPSEYGGGFWCLGFAAPGGQEGVDVIEVKIVGPYATAILSATNATALADWLNADKCIFPEDAEDIISEYIQKEWYFVATKINAVD